MSHKFAVPSLVKLVCGRTLIGLAEDTSRIDGSEHASTRHQYDAILATLGL